MRLQSFILLWRLPIPLTCPIHMYLLHFHPPFDSMIEGAGARAGIKVTRYECIMDSSSFAFFDMTRILILLNLSVSN